ncbi:hypothetical protein CRUP_021067 [Coryphaenoides rupestris]|nr:hypothetical protein CRUP_021067 [Coryphaenoides rupestris]
MLGSSSSSSSSSRTEKLLWLESPQDVIIIIIVINVIIVRATGMLCSEERLEECGVCYESYHDDPRELRCAHTFCQSCVAALCADERVVCPLCRQTTHVAGEGRDPAAAAEAAAAGSRGGGGFRRSWKKMWRMIIGSKPQGDRARNLLSCWSVGFYLHMLLEWELLGRKTD